MEDSVATWEGWQFITEQSMPSKLWTLSDDVSIGLLNVPFSGRILIVGCTCKGMWGGWHASFCYESTTLKQEIRYW